MKLSVPMEKGLALVALIAIGGLTIWLASLVPGLSALLAAILIGALVGNLRLLPSRVSPVTAWGSKKLLRIGIVFLGFKLSLMSLGTIGFNGIAILILTVTITFGGTMLIGSLLRVPKVTKILVATGFSICGASAVAAMSSVVDPEGKHEEDTAQAVALVTIYGTVLMFAIPPLATALQLTDMQAGIWIGASVHEVAQVVAAGGMVSAGALALATVAKLGRVVLLAPLVSLWSIVESRTASVELDSTKKPPIMPLFVLGFLAAVLLRTFAPIPEQLLGPLDFFANLLLAAAMLGLGFGVNIQKLIATGWKPLVLGALSTLIAVLVSIALIHLFGV